MKRDFLPEKDKNICTHTYLFGNIYIFAMFSLHLYIGLYLYLLAIYLSVFFFGSCLENWEIWFEMVALVVEYYMVPTIWSTLKQTGFKTR